MTSRSIEANRLQEDYLDRLHRVLRHLPVDQATEIELNVADHIARSLADETEEISLTRMAQVLEELGPPEDMVEDDSFRSTNGSPLPPPPPSSSPPSGANSADVPQLDRTVVEELLGKVVASYVIIIAGLYIPVIDFMFCVIIGYFLLGKLLAKGNSREAALLRPIADWARITALISLIASILGVGIQFSPFVAFLALPVSLAMFGFSLVTDWKVLGTSAIIADRIGASALAQSCRRAQILWLVCYLGLLGLGTILGVVMGLAGQTKVPLGVHMLMMLIVLPISWLLGGLILIRPIWMVRSALRS